MAVPQSEDCFFALPSGRTRVRFDGGPAAPVIVLIHGASVPHWEFDALMPWLVEAGYRVARYDLLGHGESARPRTRYTPGLFATQAQEFFANAGLDPARTAILGHSMGAAIAASLAATLRPAALVLMAPMLNFSAVNPFARVLSIPQVGELFMATLGRRALIRRRQRRYAAIGQLELAERFVAQSRIPGFWRALACMERHGALGDQSLAYRAAARAGQCPLILRGAADAIVSAEDVDRIQDLFADCRRLDLDGLEHNLMLTAPERVARHLIEHLDACLHADAGLGD